MTHRKEGALAHAQEETSSQKTRVRRDQTLEGCNNSPRAHKDRHEDVWAAAFGQPHAWALITATHRILISIVIGNSATM